MKQKNLLSDKLIDLDASELRILLQEHMRRWGQTDANNPNRLYLPEAGPSCRIALTFRGQAKRKAEYPAEIVAIEPGPAFDATEWHRISQEIENSILLGPKKVGRNYSFSNYRVHGSWWGHSSGVQILPPDELAPQVPASIGGSMAEHPFILEFPIVESGVWHITNHRRLREHRKLTHLLNLLLAGHTSLPPRRSEYLWASVPQNGDQFGEIKLVQRGFDTWPGGHRLWSGYRSLVSDTLSPPASEPIQEIEPNEYYTRAGHDDLPLRVPANLDESICAYFDLTHPNRVKFDRAAFWMGMAWRQSTLALSSCFASLVSAVEALTDKGTSHRVYCHECDAEREHDEPGATENFRSFFERYASDAPLINSRSKMYDLRSGIVHGSHLMLVDQDLAFGWDPPWSRERELLWELWPLTRLAIRNWLRNPPLERGTDAETDNGNPSRRMVATRHTWGGWLCLLLSLLAAIE